MKFRVAVMVLCVARLMCASLAAQAAEKSGLKQEQPAQNKPVQSKPAQSVPAPPVKPKLPPDDNAAIIYRYAFAKIPELSNLETELMYNTLAAKQVPLTTEVQTLLNKFDESLRTIELTRKVPDCDWELDYEKGPMMRLFHHANARRLSHIAVLRARVRFSSNAVEAGTNDILNTLKMARDVGQSLDMISFGIDFSTEKLAIPVLGENLPQLTSPQLDVLESSVQQLPKTRTLAECLDNEGRTFSDFFERDIDTQLAKCNNDGETLQALRMYLEKTLIPLLMDDPAESSKPHKLVTAPALDDVWQSLEQARAEYKQASRLAEPRTIAGHARLVDFEKDMGAKSERLLAKLRKREIISGTEWYPLFCGMLLNVSRSAECELRLHTKRWLMQAAIRVQRDGPDALKTIPTLPDCKVEYEKTKQGFVLRGRYEGIEQPIELTVGPSE